MSVALKTGLEERLCAYSRRVEFFPTAMKEFEWRNGWFYRYTKLAQKNGFPDATPMHTEYLSSCDIAVKISPLRAFVRTKGVFGGSYVLRFWRQRRSRTDHVLHANAKLHNFECHHHLLHPTLRARSCASSKRPSLRRRWGNDFLVFAAICSAYCTATTYPTIAPPFCIGSVYPKRAEF
eukprot:4415992-Pleurochrysis_carterae.AAC.1